MTNLLFLLSKNSKSAVNERDHPLRFGSPPTFFPHLYAVISTDLFNNSEGLLMNCVVVTCFSQQIYTINIKIVLIKDIHSWHKPTATSLEYIKSMHQC